MNEKVFLSGCSCNAPFGCGGHSENTNESDVIKRQIDFCIHAPEGWFYVCFDFAICKMCVERMEGYKNQFAPELGRMGGKKGGPARAASLSPERRSEIARIAAKKRWLRRTDEQR